jgi:quercetin 2,3-dioxygenase
MTRPAAPTTDREVARIVTSRRQTEGAGFVVRRPFPTAALADVDPFLLLDEMGPVEYPPGEAVGAPDHPHRGFETVTYVLEGETEHADSAGHRGTIGPGAVQWMTAGAGIVHSEMPSRAIQAEGGRVHGFQLWVNLPSRSKMMAPRYQEIVAAHIPEASTNDGLAHVRVLAGRALGVEAAIETVIPITYHHWTLRPGADVTVEVPRAMRVMIFAFGGAATIGGDTREIVDGQLAILGDGDTVRLRSVDGADLLLLGGVPTHEPIVRSGPFVMNSRDELEQAFADYRNGQLGRSPGSARA